MRPHPRITLLTTAAMVAVAGAALGTAGAHAAPAVAAAAPNAPALPPATHTVTKKALTFTVHVGPSNGTTCTIDADLYTPSGVDAAHKAPAIMATNGFGGSKRDQAGLAEFWAARGYVFLSYSGLGFGAQPGGDKGSGCTIELDDPDWDGNAGSQLLDFLGGIKKADDGTEIHDVVLDQVAHDGKHHAGDPRVGMVGGSYGGQIQFAIAGRDPRLDAIIPIITWNDLSYSLTPNDTSIVPGQSVTYLTPGVAKVDWAALFSALGIVDGVEGVGGSFDTSHLNSGTCPNFDPRVCPGLLKSAATGYSDPTTLELLRHASVVSYMSHIRIPTFLAQGENDTLFNLQESVATYHALKAQGTPVKLLFQSWGHSGGVAGPGEWDGDAKTDSYELRLFTAWFDHYLKGDKVPTGPEFEYFRDWMYHPGTAKGSDAEPAAAAAYGSATSFPATSSQVWDLSGASSLVPPGTASATAKSSPFVTTPQSGAATNFSEVSAENDALPSQLTVVHDDPGTFASFATAPLTQDTYVVGSPVAHFHVSALPAQVGQVVDPTLDLVLFVKLYDRAPDGSIELVHRLIAKARISDTSAPITVELPGIVHDFAKGHAAELVIAGADSAYKGDTAANVVTVSGSAADPSTLTLPLAPRDQDVRAAAVTKPTTKPKKPVKKPAGNGANPTVTAPGGSLAATGLGVVLPIVAVVLIGLAAAIARMRRSGD
ncbi:MAG TPA: CocE/NonD family hydrolase [Mycobacteriales bacterium]|nr:CocE/NonD family hydrolase [Mycobacteriales bacterium]